MDRDKVTDDTKLDVSETEIISAQKAFADQNSVKERLIDLKVNLVNVHRMPVYGHIILPDSNKQKSKLWQQIHLPFLYKFRERRWKKYGG